MKVSLNLLKKFIPLQASKEEVADALTLLGLEVDSIDTYGQNLSEIVAVEIQTISKHPTNNKLQILEVSSKRKKYEVVCGDLSVRKGQITALAPIGSTIYPFNSDPVKITKRLFAKIESNGVICSEKDLGISSNHDGVINLEKSELELDSIQTLYHDTIFDISLTPNLGHCRSILGTARELSAYFNLALTIPDLHLVHDSNSDSSDLIKVTNNYRTGCPQYSVCVLKNVQVKESGRGLKRMVELLGYKSVNNVVDALNYTMHLIGQPLHGFDLDMLEGSELRVEAAKGKEILSALNHKDYTLNKDAILIYDKHKPVCIAGVIGDEKTSIKETTKSIVIEAAQFNPKTIRKTTKHIGLRTDSSNRFENQTDPLALSLALESAKALIVSESNATICQGSVQCSPPEFHSKFVTLRLEKINSITGIKFSASEVQSFLERLSMPSKFNNGTLTVRIASYRNDINSEIDLVEEVLRLYGYNNIKKDQLRCTLSNQEHDKIYTFKRALGDSLQRLGFQEFVTCNLISQKEGQLESCDLNQNQELIKVLHAKSQDQSILRPSLFSGFLNAAKTNQRQKITDLRAYEIGHTYLRNKGCIQEDLCLAMLLSGKKEAFHFKNKTKECNFFTLKGALEELFTSLGMPNITFSQSKSSLFHPHQQSQILHKTESIGVFGSIHPEILNKYDCSGPLFFAELNTKSLFQNAQNIKRFNRLSVFPSSTRDLTISVAKAIKFTDLVQKLNEVSSPILKKYELIDIFEPKGTGDVHNITLRFTYRSDAKTLLDQEVLQAHDEVVLALQAN